MTACLAAKIDVTDPIATFADENSVAIHIVR